jgi:rhomboid protease GluP
VSSPPEPPRPIYTPPPQQQQQRAMVPPDWLKLAPVSRAILAVNVVVYVIQAALARNIAIPLELSLLFGANYSPATLHELRLETLVTCCFLHGGLLHVGFNMLVLWQAGPLVERTVGSARMAPMYLIAGVIGSLFSALGYAHGTAETVGPSVGASGAIMGVLASALVLGWRLQGFRGPLTQAMLRWLGFNLVFGLLMNAGGGNTDNYAHIGGAIAGGAIAVMWKRGFVYSARARTAILAACAVVVLAAAAVVVVRNVTDPFAALPVGARIDVAKIALRDGRCKDAQTAIARAARLFPDYDKTLVVEDNIALFCGTPFPPPGVR